MNIFKTILILFSFTNLDVSTLQWKFPFQRKHVSGFAIFFSMSTIQWNLLRFGAWNVRRRWGWNVRPQKRWCWPQMFCENTPIWQADVPGCKLPILGMVFPPLIGNPHNGYVNPYYWVDDHPLIPVYFYTPGSTRMGFAGTLDNLKMYFLGQFNLIEGNTWCTCLRCASLLVPVGITMKHQFLNFFQHCFFLANRSQ